MFIRYPRECARERNAWLHTIQIDHMSSPRSVRSSQRLFSRMLIPSPSNFPYFVSSLPDPSCRNRNVSAIFGAGPSFGLTPAETKPQFRPSFKKAPQPRKVKRSHSDVVLRKRPNLRRKSGDFTPQRKHSESENGHLYGVTCNGDFVFQAPLSPGSEGSDTTDQAGDIVCPLPELSQESDGDPSNRYPLFIQVNNSAQAQNKARIVKPVNRASNQGAAKQDNPQNKQSVRPGRSASFTAPRKPSESRSLVGAPNRPSQDTVKNGNLRREKSDIVRPHRTQSPSNVSAIPRPARSNSSSSLKQHNRTASPRSQSPAGLQREASAVNKHHGSPGVRREKSDVARPRGQPRTNSPIVSNEEALGDIGRSSSYRSLTSSTLCKSPSKGSIEGSRSRSGSSSEMSKIPSLARSPASAEKSDSHVSRIPSLAKQNGSEERTPPKSKIPSKGKGDKGKEAVKRSHIPTTGRKEIASQKEKPTSKIPASSTLSQNRPDSAKENKDPTFTTNKHEPAKQLSKIPSFGKSSIPKSKIPSVTRKDSQKEEPSKQNGTAEIQSPVSDSTKSKTPGAVPIQQGTGIPMGISRIPSFTKSTPKQDEPASNQSRIPTHPANKAPESKLPPPGGSNVTEQDGPVANQSRIPTIPSTPSNRPVESKLPTPGASKTPAKSPPSSLPIAPKTSGIPKPGESTQVSRIPGYPGDKSARKGSNTEHVQTGTPTASSPVETKNKIPKLATTPKSNITNGNDQASTKPKRAIPTLGGRQHSMEKESSSPVGPATPPSTPIRKDADESPLDKYIFSEAKRMEQILRDEPIEVEVFDRGDMYDDDDEFLRQEREIEAMEEEKQAKGLAMLDSKEAEDLICEVLKSYAPDINNENQHELEDIKLFTEKDDNKNIREKVNIADIVLQPAQSGNQTVKEPQVQEQPSQKLDLEFGKTVSSVKEDTVDKKQNVLRDTGKITEEKDETKAVVNKVVSPGLKIQIPTERSGDSETEERTDKETPKSEGPGIDTLGEYAQHARRSRSRQRKIVSPDSEEPENEFVAEPGKESQIEEEKKSEKEQPKKDIKKDKFGTAPFEGERKPKEAAKSTKSKSKNDKPKFVIESSLGKDFYASRKSNESVESRESMHDDAVKSSFKPELSALVFENKNAREPLTLKHSGAPSAEEAASLEEAQFVDVDLNSEPAIVKQRRELSRSVDDLDEKTVKCMCGRGGNCSIM